MAALHVTIITMNHQNDSSLHWNSEVLEPYVSQKENVWSTFTFKSGKVRFDCDVILWYHSPQPILYNSFLNSIFPDMCCDVFCHLANIWRDSSGNFIVHNDISVAGCEESTIASFSIIPTCKQLYFPLDQTTPHETRFAWSISIVLWIHE